MPDLLARRRTVTIIWLLLIGLVATGELLPPRSTLIRAVTWTGLNDKLLHFGAYTLLAAVPVFGFPLRTGLPAAAAMILLGALLDLAQNFVPGRTFDLYDILANTLGVIIGITLGLLTRRLRPTT